MRLLSTYEAVDIGDHANETVQEQVRIVCQFFCPVLPPICSIH